MFCLLQAGIGSEEEAKDPTPDVLEGGMRFGVYEIDCHADGSLCELGRGAMGVTYRATDTSLQRKVALKIIKIDIAARSADAAKTARSRAERNPGPPDNACRETAGSRARRTPLARAARIRDSPP